MSVNPQVARIGDQGLNSVNDEAIHPLGSYYRDQKTGYAYQYLKAGEELSYGDIVKPWYNMYESTPAIKPAAAVPAGSKSIDFASTVDLRASTSNLRHILENSKNKEHAQFAVVGGTGQGQRGIVLNIEDNTITVEWDSEDATLVTALDTTSIIDFYAPWFARKTTAVGEASLAVIQQRDGVKLNQYFWGAYCINGGIAVGGGTPSETVTPGAALQTAAHAGTAEVRADGTDFGVATALHGITTGASTKVVIQAIIACNLLIGEVPTRTDLGYIASTQPPEAE